VKATKRCMDLIKQYEGKELKSYQDAKGKWAIGYGQTGKHIGPGLVITDKEAEDMLRNHVESLQEHVWDLIKVKLTQEQFDALVCFAYNVGIGAFSTSTLLKELNQGHFITAGTELLRWTHSQGVELPGLIARRRAEYELFNT
jgi:lysozyme